MHAAQVATYHYDIKRMDDFAGLDEAHGQVRGGCAVCWTCGTWRSVIRAVAACFLPVPQDQGGPTRLAISSQSSDAGIKTFKVFLVQVRTGDQHARR